MKKHKGKNIKKIAMVSFGMFALILLSMVPSLIKAYTNQYGSEAEIRNSVGDILVATDNETAKTCPNGNCSSTSTELVSESTGEKFIYRLATTNAGNRTAFAIGIGIGEKLNSGLYFSQTSIEDEKISACAAAIINQYNVDVGGNTNLYYANNKKFNNYYYAAQKSLEVVFATSRTTFNSLVTQYKKQHFTDGVAKGDVKLDKLKYNNKEIARSDVYMLECIMAYLKADSNGKRLSNLSNKYATNGYVEVDSELDKTYDIIKTDMSDLYGSGASADGTNYLEAQEYNDGSYFGVSLNKVGGKSVTLTADPAKKYFYPYVYISRAQWRDGSSRYNDFQAGVCYHKASHSSACNAMFDDSRNDNYTPLDPGDYEMKITLGGKINTYGTVIYKNSNSNVTLIANNVYSVNDEDKVVFKTTFAVPEEDDSGDDDTTKDGIIHVKFIDEDGNSINGVVKSEVTLDGKFIGSSETDGGQSNFRKLAVGTYKVTITDVPDGYKIPSYQTVKLTTSVKEKTITFTIKKSTSTTDDGLIKITYYVGNKGIADGEFKAIDISTNENVGSCVTDSDGYCEIADLPIGTYKVTADSQLDGYTTAKTSVGKTYVTLYITANSKQQTATFYSDKVDQSKGTITVDYSVTSDKKIAGGVFYLYKNGVNTDECITNSLGECKFSNLEYGQYKVVLHEIPENYKETSQEKTVSISQDEPNITVQFKSSLKETLVKFNVVNANKKTEHIKGVKLVVKDSSGQPVWTLTSEGKEMVISDIKEPGTYTVEIEEVPDGYVKGDKPFTLKVVEYQENEVTITVTPTTKVPDTFANASKIFIAAGLIGIIAGTYLVYTNAKKREEV